jgi:hypothetical protein
MNTVYSSPPNWPPPPAGWTPPPGWAPDPSWPEPPPNWQFQIPAPHPPPARRTRRLWLMVGAPLVVVALIIAASITALITGVHNSVKPVEDAASSYMQALQDQHYDAAFAMLCPAAARDGHDSFVQLWSDLSSTGRGIASFKIMGVDVKTTNGRSSGRADLEVRYADGSRNHQQLPFTKTGSTWTACPDVTGVR